MAIEKIGVIGAGQMGTGISHVLALSGYDVVLDDINKDALAKAIGLIEKNMQRQLAKGLIKEEQIKPALARIRVTQTLDDLKDRDLVIEAATEDEAIKKKIFDLSREKYPDAKLFGLTTGLAVMKINSELGYEPVTYSELTQDEDFWAGCKSCVNYEILMSKDRKNCMCTAMLYDPKDHYKPEETKQFFEENKTGLERLLQFKRWKLLKPFLKKKEDNGNNSGSQQKSFLQYFFNI